VIHLSAWIPASAGMTEGVREIHRASTHTPNKKLDSAFLEMPTKGVLLTIKFNYASAPLSRFTSCSKSSTFTLLGSQAALASMRILDQNRVGRVDSATPSL